ncbi:hypothetical protein [Micromonospora palythoicola]|uniref:hypothetical protein n=1 Tax=Micromonospora palythoicola TaxID=3120507 RepID=UPI002FCE33ED
MAACVGLLNLLGLAAFVWYVMAGAKEDLFLASFIIVGSTLALTVMPAGIIAFVAAVDPTLRATAGRLCAAGLVAGALVPLPYLLRLLAGWPLQSTATSAVLVIAAVVLLVGVPAAIRHAIRRVPARGIAEAVSIT